MPRERQHNSAHSESPFFSHFCLCRHTAFMASKLPPERVQVHLPPSSTTHRPWPSLLAPYTPPTCCLLLSSPLLAVAKPAQRPCADEAESKSCADEAESKSNGMTRQSRARRGAGGRGGAGGFAWSLTAAVWGTRGGRLGGKQGPLAVVHRQVVSACYGVCASTCAGAGLRHLCRRQRALEK